MTPEDASSPPKNLVDLMAQLVPPPEPAPVSMMPQTIGWPILVGIVILAFGICLWVWRKNWQRNAYRREALAAVSAAEGDPAALARILRQTALSAFDRREVAGLHGSDWLRFLDSTCPGAQFREGPGQAIASAPYANDQPLSAAAITSVRHWISNHTVGGPT